MRGEREPLNLTMHGFLVSGDKYLPAMGGKKTAITTRKRSACDSSSLFGIAIWSYCDVQLSWWREVKLLVMKTTESNIH